MKSICIGIILCATTISLSSAQGPLIDQYEYWLNDDFNARISVPVTPVEEINLSLNLPVSMLPYGLNAFHVRAKDNAQNYSSILSGFFLRLNNTASPAALSSYEYWFNNAFNDKVTIPIGNSTFFNLTENFQTSNLNTGLNLLNICFRNTTGMTSEILSSFFIKTPQQTSQSQITAYEYWFDNDFGSKVTQAVNNETNFQLISQIPASSLVPGLHLFNIRFKNSYGKWSALLSQLFTKIPTSISPSPIVSYEYWFNNNHQDKITNTISNQMDYVLINDLASTGLNPGLNVLNIRFKNDALQWSSVMSHFFIKQEVTGQTGDHLISAYRYWYNDEFGDTTFVLLSQPSLNYTVENPINMTRIRKGHYALHFQFRDTYGKWSTILSDSIEKIPFPIADFDIVNYAICPGEAVTFINNSIDADTFLWTFGDTQSSTEENPPPHIYSTSGNYSVSLLAVDTTTNEDSLLIKANGVVSEGLLVYSKPDSIPGSLRNVIRCADPEDLITFNPALDSSILEAPMLLDKNLFIKNENAQMIIAYGDFSLQGFNSASQLIKIPSGKTLELKGLQLEIKNNGPEKSILLNNGQTTLEQMTLKGNTSQHLVNQKSAPEDDVQLIIKGNVTIKKE